MGKKTLIVKESQLQRLLENRINEVSAQDMADKLTAINCTGEDLKTLMEREIATFGFEDVRLKFIGYTEQEKDLMYMIYTEGPIFVAKARSESGEVPCMNIYDVQAYTR